MERAFPLVHLPASARSYVREVLTRGLTVCQLAAQECKLESGDIFAFLPPDIDPSTLRSFTSGGVIACEGSKDHLIEYLSSLDDCLILFESRYALSGDPFLRDCVSRILTLGTEVYHFAHSGDSIEDLNTALRESGTAIETSMLAFSLGGTNADSYVSDGSLRNIGRLISACVVIAVSAFDGEGYVLWSANR
jgi:hypothetical protein